MIYVLILLQVLYIAVTQKNFDTIMSTSTQLASISFKKQGYLFVSDGGNAKTMVENLEKQQKSQNNL